MNYACKNKWRRIMKVENINEWWIWTLNRKIAEFIHKPSEDQEIELRFLLTTYRSLSENAPANQEEYTLPAS
jgi:hypothetical protein